MRNYVYSTTGATRECITWIKDWVGAKTIVLYDERRENGVGGDFGNLVFRRHWGTKRELVSEARDENRITYQV